MIFSLLVTAATANNYNNVYRKRGEKVCSKEELALHANLNHVC